MGDGWKTWYDDAETFSQSFDIGGQPRLAHEELNRVSDQPLRDRLRSRLDVDFERLLDTAPPALAHRLGVIAAMAGHYRYSWPLLRAAAYAMPLGSHERHWALHNWRMAALEATAWSSALEAVQMLAREAPAEAPFPVERFEPLRMLGVGGFAEVYLCRSVADDQHVVVKALARKPSRQWPRDVFHECKLLGAVHDGGVPHVREFGFVDEDTEFGPYCVLDYFDGVSLHQYIESCGPLTWMNLRPILLRVLDALEATHAAGVLHCDVKPGNILMRCDSQGWQTQLIDFGIGVRDADQASGTHSEERRPGTVGFAAPEQLGCVFTSAITSAVDVYALGQTAIYALTGKPPGKCQEGQLARVAGPLSEVLLHCVEHDPRQRPRVDQLRRYLQQLDTQHEQSQREDQTTRLPAEIAPLEPATGFGTVVIAAESKVGVPHTGSTSWQEPSTGVALEHDSTVSTDPAPASSTELDCSVFAPPSLVQGDAALVQVFAHLPQHAAEVARMASSFDATAQRLGFRGLESPVGIGSRVNFTLCAPGVIIDDPVQSLVWRGRPESVQFGVTVPSDLSPRVVIASIQVTCDGAPLGCLKFRLQVLTPRENPPTVFYSGDTRLRRYRSAFVSYSSHDRSEVLKRVQMLRNIKIDVFQDVLDLKPGDAWEQELYRRIEQSDLFLLFWSSAAKESPWVAREIRHALDRRARSGDWPEIVPIVLEGPPIPAPPAELEHLHFNDEVLHHLAAAASDASSPTIP